MERLLCTVALAVVLSSLGGTDALRQCVYKKCENETDLCVHLLMKCDKEPCPFHEECFSEFSGITYPSFQCGAMECAAPYRCYDVLAPECKHLEADCRRMPICMKEVEAGESFASGKYVLAAPPPPVFNKQARKVFEEEPAPVGEPVDAPVGESVDAPVGEPVDAPVGAPSKASAKGPVEAPDAIRLKELAEGPVGETDKGFAPVKGAVKARVPAAVAKPVAEPVVVPVKQSVGVPAVETS